MLQLAMRLASKTSPFNTLQCHLMQIMKAGKPKSHSSGADPMLPEAREILKKLYKPYNEQLAKLLNDDRWLSYNA